MATSAIHHHLIRSGQRTKVGIVIETGEAREVSHCALLVGFGAGAINPYLALETIEDQVTSKTIDTELPVEELLDNYIKACNKGILKTMSKMGISSIQSYRGAQIFEAVGLNLSLIHI